MGTLTGKLRQKDRRVTGPRKAVLEALQRHPHPMTIKEIHGALLKMEVDLATVYRSIHMLREMALVKRFDFGDGVARFEMIGDGDREHHHHLVCQKCARIVEVEECFPPALEAGIAARHGFAQVTHNLEFFGTCPLCQNKR